jgi:hypothetical protein
VEKLVSQGLKTRDQKHETKRHEPPVIEQQTDLTAEEIKPAPVKKKARKTRSASDLANESDLAFGKG